MDERCRGRAVGGVVKEGTQACRHRPWGWGSEDRAREGSAAAGRVPVLPLSGGGGT
jgi:hypothetical protein